MDSARCWDGHHWGISRNKQDNNGASEILEQATRAASHYIYRLDGTDLRRRFLRRQAPKNPEDHYLWTFHETNALTKALYTLFIQNQHLQCVNIAVSAAYNCACNRL